MHITSLLAKELQCKLLLYLDNRRYLWQMKEKCSDFLDSLTTDTICKCPPLRVLLEIDVMDLTNKCPELSELLLIEPLKIRKMLNDILYACVLSTDNDYNKQVEYSQVEVNLRLKCVPRFNEPNPQNYRGLVIFEGLLLTMSKVESYVYHSVWSCPEECEGSDVILPYIPVVAPKCFVCKSVQFENSGLRRCGERVEVTIKVKNSLSPKRFHLTDDLISQLILGSRYILHAVVTKKITSVWSIEKIIVPLQIPIAYNIPKDIEQLYQACGGSSWKFNYCLASSIGASVCPLNCFMHLKICLLLSLVSLKSNAILGTSILHVLVGSYDTRFVGLIMEEAAKIADRSVVLGTSGSVSSTALIASSGGVCMMPLPLHVYNYKQISAVLTAVEEGEVKTGTSINKLKTAVWSQGMDFKKIVLFNVASVFGNVCRGDYGEYNDEIVEFVLQQAVDPVVTSREETKALKDISIYIDAIAGIEVILGENTENLLKSYFLAARKERPRGVFVSSMSALVGNCVASSRLCRRKETNIDDAVLAIWLHVSGSLEPRLAPDEYLQTPTDVRKLKTIINNFKDWLDRFIADYRV